MTKPKDLSTSNPAFLEWMQRTVLPLCTVRKVNSQDLCIGIRHMKDITGINEYHVRLVEEVDKETSPYLGAEVLLIVDWTEDRVNAEIVISLHPQVDAVLPDDGYILSQFPGYYIRMHSSFEHFLKSLIKYKSEAIINAIIIVDSRRIM